MNADDILLAYRFITNIQPYRITVKRKNMLKYEGRMTVANKIVKQGKPIDGKHVFRNAAAQELFDKMRDNSDVMDYGIDDRGFIFFAYLNGVVERYSRREFIRMAEE